jgi:hypothetical protein
MLLTIFKALTSSSQSVVEVNGLMNLSIVCFFHAIIRPCDLVLFDKNGMVKVADFGLAKVLDGGRTSTRTLVGVSVSLSDGRYGVENEIHGEAMILIDRTFFDAISRLCLSFLGSDAWIHAACKSVL